MTVASGSGFGPRCLNFVFIVATQWEGLNEIQYLFNTLSLQKITKNLYKSMIYVEAELCTVQDLTTNVCGLTGCVQLAPGWCPASNRQPG